MVKQNLKQHIVQTASELFYANGYNKTGINEIISKSAIAKATLYHHFKSKEAIALAYLEQKHDVFMNTLNEMVVKTNGKNAQLLVVFDYLRELFRDDDFQGCWCQKLLGEIPVSETNLRNRIQKHKLEFLNFLTELVTENSQQLSKAEIEKIAQGIYLLYESAITEAHLLKNDWPIHSAKNLASTLILKDL